LSFGLADSVIGASGGRPSAGDSAGQSQGLIRPGWTGREAFVGFTRR